MMFSLTRPDGVTIVRRMAEVMVDRSSGIYPLTVSFGLTMADMVRAGCYVVANSNINAENFPLMVSGKVDLEAILIHLNYEVCMGEVLAEINRLGLRAATMPELLAFGARYPVVQRQFAILALGSVWNFQADSCAHTVPYYGCLRGSAHTRVLDIKPVEDIHLFSQHDRFLAIRK